MAPPVPAPDETDFEPASLVAEPFPVEVRLGIALRLAASGALEEAASCGDDLAKSLDAADPLRDRVVRESRRLHELVQWRRDFIEQWKAGTKKLRIDHDGSSTTGTLKGVEQGDVVLLDSKGRELRVALAALDCDQVLRLSSEAKLEFATPIVRACAQLVAGRKNWAKGLTEKTPEESALKADAAAWPELFAMGEAAARLQKLAHLAAPANGVQAAAALADLRPLLSEKESSKEAGRFIEPRRPLLRRFATLCFQREFASAGIAGTGILKGRALAKPDGSVRVVYDFDDPAEAEDWISSPAVIDGRQTDGKGGTLKTPLDRSWFKIEDGFLRGNGIAGWSSKLEFEAPVSVAYRYRTGPVDPRHPTENILTIRVSICDDLQSSRNEAIDFFGVMSFDAAARFFEETMDLKIYTWGTVYDARLANDGKEVTLAITGTPDRKVACGPRKSGHVGLWIYSDALVEFDHVEIEGRVVEASLAPLRSAWIDRQLAALEKGESQAPAGEKRGK